MKSFHCTISVIMELLWCYISQIDTIMLPPQDLKAIWHSVASDGIGQCLPCPFYSCILIWEEFPLSSPTETVPCCLKVKGKYCFCAMRKGGNLSENRNELSIIFSKVQIMRWVVPTSKSYCQLHTTVFLELTVFCTLILSKGENVIWCSISSEVISALHQETLLLLWEKPEMCLARGSKLFPRPVTDLSFPPGSRQRRAEQKSLKQLTGF